MNRPFSPVGWRLWALKVGPNGPYLSTPIATGDYWNERAAGLEWESSRHVRATCINGCPQPPGQNCGCGIYYAPDRRDAAFLTDWCESYRSPEMRFAVSYGYAIGKTQPDPWFTRTMRLARATGFGVLSLAVWQEDANLAEKLHAAYDGVPILKSPRLDGRILDLLAQVAR